VLEDTTNVERSLYGYSEAVRVGCGHETVEKESIVKALDMVPYSVYTEDEGEEISFANEKTVDNITKKFNGKKCISPKSDQKLKPRLKLTQSTRNE
jgi:hypothetical protein